MNNNYAFIDSQNLNLAIRKAGWQLDFRKFRVYLKDKYKVQKAYLFIGYIPENKRLYYSLRKMGYILRFKPTVQDNRGAIKGNCDAELILNCMIQYKNFDKAIIVSGDGDFYCLIKYLEKKKKIFKILIPDRYYYSSLLKRFRRYIDYMNQLKAKLQYNKKRGSNLRTKP